jgi:hypothetical protein
MIEDSRHIDRSRSLQIVLGYQGAEVFDRCASTGRGLTGMVGAMRQRSVRRVSDFWHARIRSWHRRHEPLKSRFDFLARRGHTAPDHRRWRECGTLIHPRFFDVSHR